MRKKERRAGAIGQLIGRVLVYLARRLFPSDMKSILERTGKFQLELERALSQLLIDHGGEVYVIKPTRVPPFGYLTAVAKFPDRKLTFVRGRAEFYATMEVAGRERGFFSTSMPSGSGDNGNDGGALSRCVALLQEHWEELPAASDADVARFDMQTRKTTPMFALLSDE